METNQMANIHDHSSLASQPDLSRLVDVPQSLTQRLLLTCGVVGPVLFIVAYLIEGIIHPGYDLLRQTISELEILTNGWMQVANFIVFGLLIVGFAVGLRSVLVRGKGAIWVPLLEGLVALGLVGDGLFVRDPLHTLFDIMTFVSAMLVSFTFAWRVAGDSRWRGWAIYSIATGILLVVFLILFGVAMAHDGPAGLFERLATLVRSIWTVLLAARLLSGARLSPPDAGSSPVIS
jgi:hypothetical membrane protein